MKPLQAKRSEYSSDISERELEDKTVTLLFDGSCGLCARTVQFILRNESASVIRFAPLDGVTASVIRAQHSEALKTDSIVLYRIGSNSAPEVLLKSDAVVGILGYMGGRWRTVARVLSAIPKLLRDMGYDIVAASRYSLFGSDTSCLLPTPEQRLRFDP